MLTEIKSQLYMKVHRMKDNLKSVTTYDRLLTSLTFCFIIAPRAPKFMKQLLLLFLLPPLLMGKNNHPQKSQI